MDGESERPQVSVLPNAAPALASAQFNTEIKALLRETLKVGPEMAIADDMPLIGGPIDIDSIDILLVISTIEKRFGMKIPNEAIGRAAFSNVGTLTRYVADNRELLKVRAVDTPVAAVNWLDRLPQGPAFRFVSEVREVEPGHAALGYWQVTGGEAFFEAHFPGNPVVPGVLLTEALAQIAGIALASNGSTGGRLAETEMRFLARVVPPARIELRAEAMRGGRCAVTASVAGIPVAQGTIRLAFE